MSNEVPDYGCCDFCLESFAGPELIRTPEPESLLVCTACQVELEVSPEPQSGERTE